MAVMVGLCYLGTVSSSQAGIQSVQGAIFLLVTENTFGPMYSVLALFPEDVPLFLREYKSGLYPAGLFYVSKIVAMVRTYHRIIYGRKVILIHVVKFVAV